MEKTIKVINELIEDGIIKHYAIGGAIASTFYIEPVATYDLDVFFTFDDNQNKIISLEPIYQWMEKRGYKTSMEYIIIEGVPVQLIPVYNDLIREAVLNSIEKKFNKTTVNVITPEYLIAIMLQTFRAKDKERILRFLEEVKINYSALKKLLMKFSLEEKFIKIKKL